MGVATTVRDAANIKRANENETRREMIASWYITMPGIPSSEKEQLEKSLRYNQSLGKLVSFYLNFTGRSNILPSFFCSAALYA